MAMQTCTAPTRTKLRTLHDALVRAGMPERHARAGAIYMLERERQNGVFGVINRTLATVEQYGFGDTEPPLSEKVAFLMRGKKLFATRAHYIAAYNRLMKGGRR